MMREVVIWRVPERPKDDEDDMVRHVPSLQLAACSIIEGYMDPFTMARNDLTGVDCVFSAKLALIFQSVFTGQCDTSAELWCWYKGH